MYIEISTDNRSFRVWDQNQFLGYQLTTILPLRITEDRGKLGFEANSNL